MCGADQREKPCGHKKGRYYGGKGAKVLCYHSLEEPTDAYEWSFVAVPAQPKAGVVKGFSPKKGGENMNFEDVKKALSSGEEITLSAEQSGQILSDIKRLESLASFGKCQMENLRKEVSRLGGIARPEIGIKKFEDLVKALDADSLSTLKRVFETEAAKKVPMPRQIESDPNTQKPENDKFII